MQGEECLFDLVASGAASCHWVKGLRRVPRGCGVSPPTLPGSLGGPGLVAPWLWGVDSVQGGSLESESASAWPEVLQEAGSPLTPQGLPAHPGTREVSGPALPVPSTLEAVLNSRAARVTPQLGSAKVQTTWKGKRCLYCSGVASLPPGVAPSSWAQGVQWWSGWGLALLSTWRWPQSAFLNPERQSQQDGMGCGCPNTPECWHDVVGHC